MNTTDAPALLDVESLSIRYGGVVAIPDLSFSIPEGSVVGLIGPNGAGKTSLVDGLSGAHRPSSGTVRLRGRDITGEPPHTLARRGLTRTFQSAELFDDLTVLENLKVAAEKLSVRRALAQIFPRRTRGGQENVEWAAEVAEISHLLDRMPSQLTHGQRKLVGVARALASRPSLLLLDEPAAGLDTTETKELGRQLRTLPTSGTSLLLIDHDMSLVLEICDLVLVIDFGELIAQGTPAQIRLDQHVIDAYLGQETTVEARP
ncbi:MAG: ABC transporter ATP-binding protein [Microbacterium sp.]|uniref:ABC transporter ATP-binding protein n=1 Tax=Microbacterium sp. TaxID=51671 RepID=UPI0039E27BA3